MIWMMIDSMSLANVCGMWYVVCGMWYVLRAMALVID